MATSKGPPPPGSIWTQRTTSQTSGWTGSGVSANGKYSIINGLNYAGNDGYVLYSTNFGVTWNEAASGESGTFSKGSCVSDNGAIMAYTSGTTNTIRLSTNGGLTFSAVGPTSPTIKEWANICCSSDGSIMYAYDVGNYGNGYQGAIYKSINSGATWSNIGSPASAILTAPATYYASICCSPDGTKVAITVYNYGGGIWISTNSGSTWSEKREWDLLVVVGIILVQTKLLYCWLMLTMRYGIHQIGELLGHKLHQTVPFTGHPYPEMEV